MCKGFGPRVKFTIYDLRFTIYAAVLGACGCVVRRYLSSLWDFKSKVIGQSVTSYPEVRQEIRTGP